MQPRKIIRDREIVDDNFRYVADIAELAAGGDIIVDLALWNAHKPALQAHPGKIGVKLEGDAEPESIAGDLAELALVVIHFPVFRDGRGFSLARILRGHLGFQGELRAVGDVLRDQLFFMQRCGFNAYEPRRDRSMEDALKGLNDFSVIYQADASEKRPIYRRRG